VIYDFRHSCATRFAEATHGDVVALAAILGHGNLRTVMRYVHVSREHRRAQMSRFIEAEKIQPSGGNFKEQNSPSMFGSNLGQMVALNRADLSKPAQIKPQPQVARFNDLTLIWLEARVGIGISPVVGNA
jgi:hypothetical protein